MFKAILQNKNNFCKLSVQSHKHGYPTRYKDLFKYPTQHTKTLKNYKNYFHVIISETARRNQDECHSWIGQMNPKFISIEWLY